MYDNELKTKGKKFKPRIKLNHSIYKNLKQKNSLSGYVYWGAFDSPKVTNSPLNVSYLCSDKNL